MRLTEEIMKTSRRLFKKHGLLSVPLLQMKLHVTAKQAVKIIDQIEEEIHGTNRRM